MVERADIIWADGPATSPTQPDKRLIREWATSIEAVVTAFVSAGGLIYPALSNLTVDLSKPANAMAWVQGDPVSMNNGVYMKVGGVGTGSWQRMGDLPYSFVAANDAGAGTPNAIVATSSLPVTESVLVVMGLADTNTSTPVTIAFNGGVPLTVVNASGSPIKPGDLKAGTLLTGFKSGLNFRLTFDVSPRLVKADNLGGTNAISATTPAAIPTSTGDVLVVLPILAANTESPVTVSFNGGTPLTIKSNTGTDIAVGGLQPGMMVLGTISGTSFRIFNDQVSGAIVAQAQAAAEAAIDAAEQAEAAAAGVNLPATGDQDVGKALIAGASGYSLSNLANDISGARRTLPETYIEGKRFDSSATGSQSVYLFVGRLENFRGAKLEVFVAGNVNGGDIGQVSRTFDLFRVSEDVLVRSNAETYWTSIGGSAPSANFFTLGCSPEAEDGAQFIVGVAFTSSGPSNFGTPRARIIGDAICFGAVGRSQLNRNVEHLLIILVIGQSNAQDYNSQGFATQDCLDPGRAQMFNKGLRLLSDLINPSESIGDYTVRALVDARETADDDNPDVAGDDATLSQQTFGTPLMNGLLRGEAAGVGAAVMNTAVGGQAYSAIKKGTTAYSNALFAVAKARAIAASEGRSTSIPFIPCEHGESNSGDSVATYLAHLLEWQSDFNTDLAEPAEVPFIGTQYSYTDEGGPPQAWLQAALTYPEKFILAGARYHYGYTDGIHLNWPSVFRHGYYLARAYRLWKAGDPHPFMHVQSAVKTGNKVLLTVHMPVPGTALGLDTTTVSNPGGANPYGLRYSDSAGQTITAVNIVGANQIELTLSGSAAASAKTIFVAKNPAPSTPPSGGVTTAARACFRDNNTEMTPRLPALPPQNLWNWLVHQVADVTGT